MDAINTPTHLAGERVVCMFPIIGGIDGFVEAAVVTSDGDENVVATRFTVRSVDKHGGLNWSAEESLSSFPDAIRIARKNAGWG